MKTPTLELFDAGPVQLWTALSNGSLDYVNTAVLTYFGRAFDDMIAWGWADLVHPDDLALVGEKWGQSLESGVPYRVEFRLRRHDGVFLRHLARAEAKRDADQRIVKWVGANFCIDTP